MTDEAAAAPATVTLDDRTLRKVVIGSGVGTVFETYDFILFASLAPIISTQFFAGVNETAAFIFALLTFAAGYAIRPLGALVFGRIGDSIGRKKAFLATITMMGLATFAIGLLPTYSAIGIWSPVLLISMRLIQGLAFGGEYGGAVVYMAEHAPHGKRGLYTGWIQTAAGFGLFSSLVLIMASRTFTGEAAFAEWGWRIPFLISAGLLVVSFWIRMRLEESPVFQEMQAAGTGSKAPLREAFLEWRNLKLVLLALFGLMAPYSVLWYNAHFYTQYFLDQTLHVAPATVTMIMVLVTGVGVLLYVFFGWLSDRVGRKPVILTGLILGTVTLFPFFHGLTGAANPALATAQQQAPVTVVADPGTCSLQFDPVGEAQFVTSCDIAKSALAGRGIAYTNVAAPPGTTAAIRVGDTSIESFNGEGLPDAALKKARAEFIAELEAALKAAGYPQQADPAAVQLPIVIAIILAGVAFSVAIFGPMAAVLCELFPTRIRYSALSLPYHIGAGWFGGFLPATAFAMVAATGDIYFGLWYPFIIAAMGIVVVFFFLPETKDRDIRDI